jgi:hypothetical protein
MISGVDIRMSTKILIRGFSCVTIGRDTRQRRTADSYTDKQPRYEIRSH